MSAPLQGDAGPESRAHGFAELQRIFEAEHGGLALQVYGEEAPRKDREWTFEIADSSPTSDGEEDLEIRMDKDVLLELWEGLEPVCEVCWESRWVDTWLCIYGIGEGCAVHLCGPDHEFRVPLSAEQGLALREALQASLVPQALPSSPAGAGR